MRIQEKETINEMPQLLWNKFSKEDQKEYLNKWKASTKKSQQQGYHERNINLIESINDFTEVHQGEEQDSESEQHTREAHVSNITSYNQTIPRIMKGVNTTLKGWKKDFVPYVVEGKVSIKQTQIARSFNTSSQQPYSIMDNGADTSVIGHGWYIQMIDQFRRMNIIGFDSERSKKTELRVDVAVTALDLPNGEAVFLRISEAAYNPNSQHSLLSEFQLQEKRCKIDSKARRHGGSNVSDSQDLTSL